MKIGEHEELWLDGNLHEIGFDAWKLLIFNLTPSQLNPGTTDWFIDIFKDYDHWFSISQETVTSSLHN